MTTTPFNRDGGEDATKRCLDDGVTLASDSECEEAPVNQLSTLPDGSDASSCRGATICCTALACHHPRRVSAASART